MILEIDGYEVTNITDYDDSLSVQDSEDSGRNANLDMHRDILGEILTIDVAIGVSPQNKVQELISVLKNSEMRVRFFNTRTGKLETCESMYCNDPQKTRLKGVFGYFERVEFKLISNGRYES